MSNRYFLNDGGNVCYYGNEVWKKVGTTLSFLPDASSPDVVNITGETFNNADPQSRTQYSAEEMAVTNEKIGRSDVSWSGTEKQTFWASAPYSGVVRVWQDYSQDVAVYVNGTEVVRATATSRANSFCANVAAGDLVEGNMPDGGPTGGHAILIPFQYTNPG